MDFITQPTESALKDWRFGSPQAERLCSTLLHSEGFNRIEPQSPLGGPDGLKDVLFNLNGWRYVAAVYFPPTEKQFSDVKAKFSGDLAGVSKKLGRRHCVLNESTADAFGEGRTGGTCQSLVGKATDLPYRSHTHDPMVCD